MKELLALFGGSLAWTLHLFISYALVGIGCLRGWALMIPALLAITVVCVAGAVAAGMLARTFATRAGGMPAEDMLASSAWLGVIGMAASSLFAVAMLMAGLTPLMVPLCALTP